jgi:hypothetical protein
VISINWFCRLSSAGTTLQVHGLHGVLRYLPPRFAGEGATVIRNPSVAPSLVYLLAKIMAGVVVSEVNPTGLTDLVRGDAAIPWQEVELLFAHWT